jgi:ADP-heptose:LPS heptosyltransferase
MANHKLQKAFFDGSSRITGHFPRAGSKFLDNTLRPLAGNHVLSAFFALYNRRILGRVKSFRRFLIIPDIHIGDSVISQSALTGLRDFFPDAHVDYVSNSSAHPLIKGNPDATRVLPLFSGGCFPTSENLACLRDLIKKEEYDLCLNFCPFIDDKDIVPGRQAILNVLSHAPSIVRNEGNATQINHFIYQSYKFTRDMLSFIAAPLRREALRGVDLRFADSAVEQALRFASELSLASDEPVIMFNPDGASLFTRMPFDKQADLLGRLARLKALILLGSGHSAAGIGERLKASLPPLVSGRVIIIPRNLPLEVYAALIDFSDVFITGDTGPLHLAAAHRISQTGKYTFRNRTAVLSFFGATPARMSGYDSSQPGFLPANQEAPSWAYTAGSPCRNITCLNKLFKSCRSARCFEKVDLECLSGRIAAYLELLAKRMPLRRGPAAA